MASNVQVQEGPPPASLDDFSAVKSKWVVMQHSNKKAANNLHDLASVPDFDLLDPVWLDSAPLEAVQGKPGKQPQYEVVVDPCKQAGTTPAKDGELETILNNDVDNEPQPPPPAPLFRDDEMESWLLATLDDPNEGNGNGSGVAQERPTPEKKASSLAEQDTPGNKMSKAAAEASEGAQHQGSSGAALGRPASPNLQQLQQQLNMQRMQQRMKLQQQLLSEQAQGTHEQRDVASQQPMMHSMRVQMNGVANALQQQQLQRSQHQKQQLLKQEQDQQQQQQQQQQLATLKQLQEEENEMQRQLQERKAQIQEQKQRLGSSEAGANEAHIGHAQLLHRQMMHQQQQQQQLSQQLEDERQKHEEIQGLNPVSSGQTGSSAPLNFSHFSRPAHLYSRANLKTIGAAALRGPGSTGAATSTQSGSLMRSGGSMPKLPHGSKYPNLSGATSLSESTKLSQGVGVADGRGGLSAAAHMELQLQRSAPHGGSSHARDEEMCIPASGDPNPAASGASAGRRSGMVGRVSGGQYASMHSKGTQEDKEKDSQGQAHTSTVTETPPATERRMKAEKETTVCSAPGASIMDRRHGASMLSRGAATEMSARSSGSRFLKRGREETEYTMSETMLEESADTRRTGRMLPGESGGGPLESSAAKRARAAEVHNLSERRRRDRINERMRMLQELIPNSNKTDKASMLDEAIEYLKMLQLQLQVMSMRSGMSIPSNLVPGGGSSFPTAGASPGMSQMSLGEDSLPTGMPKMAAMGSLGDSMPGCPDLGLAEMAAAGFSMPESAAAMAMGGGGGMEREMSAMQGAMGAIAGMGSLGQRDMSSLPARQRLLMEMMQVDMQEQQQQQQLMQQQQQMLLASKAGAMASLQRNAAARSGSAGLPPGLPPMGVMLKSEPMSRASSLANQMPGQASFAAYTNALRGNVNSGMNVSGFGMGDNMPGGNTMGAMAAAAVMLEGHRQLNPSAVDPLDVYLARQQRMQQQQMQLQEEQQQQQQQQAAVDFQMYQAILKRQNQNM